MIRSIVGTRAEALVGEQTSNYSPGNSEHCESTASGFVLLIIAILAFCMYYCWSVALCCHLSA